MRYLVDTNVLLELFLIREKHDSVQSFFVNALIRKNQTYVSAMSLRDFGYFIHKNVHDTEKTKIMLMRLHEMISKVVDTTADAAIESIYSENNDYEDSMQMITAEEAMCDAIITFNKKDFEQSKLPVFTPEEMLDIWSRNK